jgi:hypothetical protein
MMQRVMRGTNGKLSDKVSKNRRFMLGHPIQSVAIVPPQQTAVNRSFLSEYAGMTPTLAEAAAIPWIFTGPLLGDSSVREGGC